MSRIDLDRLRCQCGEDVDGIFLEEVADEIESLWKKYELRTIALQHACGLAQAATHPVLESLNAWRRALGWEDLPANFEF